MEEQMYAANFICCQLKLTQKLSQQFCEEKATKKKTASR
jgi:hypothetical protein